MLTGMKFAIFATFTVVVCLAADPDKPMFWSAAQNKDFDKRATAKLNNDRHLGTERLMDSAFVAFRNGSGEAELHVKQADLLLIRSGSGTVVVGGEMIEGKPTAPDEEVHWKVGRGRDQISDRRGRHAVHSGQHGTPVSDRAGSEASRPW